MRKVRGNHTTNSVMIQGKKDILNSEMDVMRLGLPKIVVLGAGYGSLMTVKKLQKELHYNEAEIILINPNSYHYVTTKLHEPAAGTANHMDSRIDIDSVVDFQRVQFIQDWVEKIDITEKTIYLRDGESVKYDYVVVGIGSSPETFGIQGLLENAFFIRDLNSVCTIRQHIEYMFSHYKKDQDEEFLTLIVGGAGFTGVEYIGELVERINVMCTELDIPREKVRLINIEAMPTVLPGFDPELVEYAQNFLEGSGVELRVSTPIESCTRDGVRLKNGEEIRAKTVIWTGGIRGNHVVEDSGIETMRGRVKVDEFLRIPGREDVFVVGDCSLVFDEENKPFPPTAQIATAQGQHLGQHLTWLLRGGAVRPFTFKPKGTIASLGKREAVGFIGSKKFVGGTAAVLKKLIDLRWLYLLGGFSLVWRKGRTYFKF